MRGITPAKASFMAGPIRRAWAVTSLPIRLHVVGTVIQRVPLQLSLPGNNFATVVAGDNVAIHDEPGHARLDGHGPQRGLRVFDAAADQSQGIGGFAARPLQVDAVPRSSCWLRYGRLDSDGLSAAGVVTSVCRHPWPSWPCPVSPDLRRTSDRSAGTGNRPRA